MTSPSHDSTQKPQLELDPAKPHVALPVGAMLGNEIVIVKDTNTQNLGTNPKPGILQIKLGLIDYLKFEECPDVTYS